MTQYAKYISETEIQLPQASEFIGIPNWQTHDCKLREKHYRPLHDVPEDREGYRTVLDRFTFTSRTKTRKEPRREDPVTKEPFMEDVMEWDEETQQMKKVGERQVTREVNVVLDDSFITVVASHYEELPPPEPPDTTARDNAEKAIVGAIKALADKYDAATEIAVLMHDGGLTIPALMELASTKGVPEAELGALITELTPFKWQLEAVTGLLWSEAWEGLKSRFPAYWSEIILDQGV